MGLQTFFGCALMATGDEVLQRDFVDDMCFAQLERQKLLVADLFFRPNDDIGAKTFSLSHVLTTMLARLLQSSCLRGP